MADIIPGVGDVSLASRVLPGDELVRYASVSYRGMLKNSCDLYRELA